MGLEWSSLAVSLEACCAPLKAVPGLLEQPLHDTRGAVAVRNVVSER